MGDLKPWHDCPACPDCTATVGTPARIECGVERGRWNGPENANLFCPCCGAGWVGSAEDVAQAERAWAAYEAAVARGEA